MSLFCFVYSGETPALYTVLPEKQASVGGAMMGSAHVYDIAAVSYSQCRHIGLLSLGPRLKPTPARITDTGSDPRWFWFGSGAKTRDN